jgi:hypothetical protein
VGPQAELDDLEPQAQDLEPQLDAGATARAWLRFGRVSAGVVVVVVAGAVVVVGWVGTGVLSSANAAGMRASAKTIRARGAKRFMDFLRG